MPHVFSLKKIRTTNVFHNNGIIYVKPTLPTDYELKPMSKDASKQLVANLGIQFSAPSFQSLKARHHTSMRNEGEDSRTSTDRTRT